MNKHEFASISTQDSGRATQEPPSCFFGEPPLAECDEELAPPSMNLLVADICPAYDGTDTEDESDSDVFESLANVVPFNCHTHSLQYP